MVIRKTFTLLVHPNNDCFAMSLWRLLRHGDNLSTAPHAESCAIMSNLRMINGSRSKHGTGTVKKSFCLCPVQGNFIVLMSFETRDHNRSMELGSITGKNHWNLCWIDHASLLRNPSFQSIKPGTKATIIDAYLIWPRFLENRGKICWKRIN